MTITVGYDEYEVRHNYLHRGVNPRLILNTKEEGGLVWVRFEDNNEVTKYLQIGTQYKGYWCNKYGYREIEILVKEK